MASLRSGLGWRGSVGVGQAREHVIDAVARHRQQGAQALVVGLGVFKPLGQRLVLGMGAVEQLRELPDAVGQEIEVF